VNAILLTGSRVRLACQDAQETSLAFARWQRDTQYVRLLSTDPAFPWSAEKIKSWMVEEQEKPLQDEFFFNIRTIPDDLLIGFVGLHEFSWAHGDAWVAIGIGERQYWGKGYGTEAMRLALQFAFMELNLWRVSLGVYNNNTRAIRSYQKAGFQIEGLQRSAGRRAGQVWDICFMGILRREWEKSLE